MMMDLRFAICDLQLGEKRRRAPFFQSQIANRKSQISPPGFTLNEILIVIGIIVLMLALAVPMFNIIKGNRSTEAAANQLSALFARARTEAIAYQRPGGLMFFRHPKTPDRVSAAPVFAVTTPDGGTLDVYLELIPERDFFTLSPGISMQFVDDCYIDSTTNPPTRKDD